MLPRRALVTSRWAAERSGHRLYARFWARLRGDASVVAPVPALWTCAPQNVPNAPQAGARHAIFDAKFKIALVDLGELTPGTYTVSDSTGGAEPIQVVVS